MVQILGGGTARLGVLSKPIIVKRTRKKHWLLKDGIFLLNTGKHLPDYMEPSRRW
jgi:hypothetical protein